MKQILRLNILICALLSVVPAAGSAQMRKMPPAFEAWLETPQMRHATVAVEVTDLNTGQVLWALDEQRSVQPASLMKLVTTGAALRKLGGDYIIPDTVCCADTSMVPLPQLVGYNPDWLIEDVEADYVRPLTCVPDAGLPLSDFIRKTNEKSLNENAELLPYLLTPDRNLYSGLDTIRNYWQSRGLDVGALVMYDGCGLAPADRVTAHFMTELLTEMKDEEMFRNSLAVAGMTGTVMFFLKASCLAGRAQLKTGTTKSVVAYAGYVEGSDGHTYSIAFIVNNSTAKVSTLRKNIEKMFLLLIP